MPRNNKEFVITGYYTFTTFVDEEKCISDGKFSNIMFIGIV